MAIRIKIILTVFHKLNCRPSLFKSLLSMADNGKQILEYSVFKLKLNATIKSYV